MVHEGKMEMFRSLRWYLKFVVTLVAKTPLLWQAKRILESDGQEAFDAFCYDITSKWAKERLLDSGATVTVFDQDRVPMDRNVLFVSNHQSDFDIAIFLALINKPKGFIAKVEMEKVPLLRDWMRNIHCVFMDREDLKQSLETILAGIKLLKAGYSMVVFPEGTRSRTSVMGEFKAGSFKLATKSDAPIVPVTIHGSYKIMEGNGYVIKPAEVKVYIHYPIYMEMLSKEEKAELPERVWQIINEPLVQAQKAGKGK